MKSSLGEVARILGVPVAGESPITGWSIDSRTLEPGDLFFALKGPNHDAHVYVEQVLEKGAAGVVVEHGEGERRLVVADVLQALQSVASALREKWGGDVTGVTGSAGKTTTKDVIARLLETELAVGKTTGNFNNHVGVPLSVLRLPETARVGVLELGMNHGGEIRELAKIARPRIGVVTNVGHAHIESFESIEGIALAKRELIEALPRDGVAVLNADDPRVAKFGEVHPGKTVTFGITQEADVRAEGVEYSVEGVRFRVEGTVIESPLIGRHGVLNILAGIAVAKEYGIAVERLKEVARTLEPGAMRGRRTVDGQGITHWNDCYNSNPDAVRAMVDVLRDTPARRRIAVLGEMLELGRWSEPLHREVGQYIAASGIPVLVGIRGAARHMVEAAIEAGMDRGAAYFFDEPEKAGELVSSIARPGDAILWKGSRGTRVEKGLERFQEMGKCCTGC